MTSSGSPCGACKFLRRKCVRGCIFAAYFCHEQAAKDFAAIHKVFGASNVSKLLAHLPVTDRHEAAVSIIYEAHARIQDPIYGCVSHISALQQQVANLQAQLTSLKQQAAGSLFVHSSNPNPSGKLPEKLDSYQQQHVPTWSQLENPNFLPHFIESNANHETMLYGQNTFTSLNSSENSLDSIISTDQSVPLATLDENFQSLPSSLEIDTYNYRSWNVQEADNELRSVAFGYNERCW